MKVFFVHIPKTAGTSINDYFSSLFGGENVLVHIEGRHSVEQTVAGIRNGPFYISGHLRVPQALQLVKDAGWITFATVRNPVDQLIAHLNELKKLAKPENRHILLGHNIEMKEAVENFRGISLSDTKKIENLIYNSNRISKTLFDNCLVRYCIDDTREDVNFSHVVQALANMEKLHAVSDITNLTELLNRVHDLSVPDAPCATPRKVPHSNQSRMSETVDLTDRRVRDFYMAITGFDMGFYCRLRTLKNYVGAKPQ